MGQERATLILTRPKTQSEQFANLVQSSEFGLRIVVSPLLEIVPIAVPPRTSRAAGMIFTSKNGVAFWNDGDGRPAYCVGKATAQAARERNWDSMALGGSAEDLVTALIDLRPPGPLLHVGGVHKRGAIAERLMRAGIPTEEVAAYDQRVIPLSEEALVALGGGKPVIVPLFSPRTAGQFATQFRGNAHMHILALSDAVMAEVGSLNAASRQVAQSPDSEAMLAAVRNLLRRVEASGAPK